MEATHDAATARGSAPPPGGELVVQTGRLAGTRRLLGVPLTFIGRSPGCDLRLNADGVNPLHCLIAHGPTGLVVRDLDSEHGTTVNGARVTHTPLCDGDLLAVGPFQFRVKLPASAKARPAAGPETEQANQAEKDALRVQAAAVAAQQAGLAEEETRLLERRGTLEQQESQLAAHLEEKRKRLLQIAEHAQTARAALQKERADYEKHVEHVTSGLGEAQRELLESQQKTQVERQRLIDLRRRLKQRWHRHWMAERKKMCQREEVLAAGRRSLDKEAECLRQERAELGQARLRSNGEVELDKRRLRDERDVLRQERARWQEERERAQAGLDRRERGLAERAAGLADAERNLDDEKYRWERAREFIKKEVEGLDNRIRNQRGKVLDHQEEIEHLEARLRGLRRAVTEAAAAGSTVPVTVLLPAPTEGAAVPSPSAAPAAAAGEQAAPASAAEPPQPALPEMAGPPPPLVPQEDAAGTALMVVAPTPVVVSLAPPQVHAVPSTPAPVEEERGLETLTTLEEALAERDMSLREAEQLLHRRAALLEKLANDLADQRLILVEHWARLAVIEGNWHQGRRAALAELEGFVAGLPAKEEGLVVRQRAAEAAENELRRRHQEAVYLRQQLESWSARLRIRESTWESERDRLLLDVRGREELAERHLASMADLRQRWTKRRRQELDTLRAERATPERLRQKCAALRDELWKRGNALEEERRVLAEKTLALEQYRQQYVVRAADAATAERRVEKLRQRWVAQNANLVRATVAEREALHQEVARLNELHTSLHKHMESLTTREASLGQRQAAWEEAQALAESQQARLRQELQSMQGQRDRYALHLIELQDEVERIARILLDEPQLPLVESSHAA